VTIGDAYVGAEYDKGVETGRVVIWKYVRMVVDVKGGASFKGLTMLCVT